MKANNIRFGQVTITSKTSTGLNIITEAGEAKTVMMGFVKFYDNDGVEITDFSEVENEVFFANPKTSGCDKKVNPNSVRELMGRVNEINNENYDHKTKSLKKN